jgi:hypothetical protein
VSVAGSFVLAPLFLLAWFLCSSVCVRQRTRCYKPLAAIAMTLANPLSVCLVARLNSVCPLSSGYSFFLFVVLVSVSGC